MARHRAGTPTNDGRRPNLVRGVTASNLPVAAHPGPGHVLLPLPSQHYAARDRPLSALIVDPAGRGPTAPGKKKVFESSRRWDYDRRGIWEPITIEKSWNEAKPRRRDVRRGRGFKRASSPDNSSINDQVRPRTEPDPCRPTRDQGQGGPEHLLGTIHAAYVPITYDFRRSTLRIENAGRQFRTSAGPERHRPEGRVAGGP